MLHDVLDPEVPAISVTDLGIVRDVIAHDDGLEVVVTPTYSGCPATEVIDAGDLRRDRRRRPRARARDATARARVDDRLDHAAGPREAARLRHRAAGLVRERGDGANVSPIRLMARNVDCPRCGSAQTERLSAFGSTACKSLYRCVACREPFEYFKPI